jgi:hypothetical protein
MLCAICDIWDVADTVYLDQFACAERLSADVESAQTTHHNLRSLLRTPLDFETSGGGRVKI